MTILANGGVFRTAVRSRKPTIVNGVVVAAGYDQVDIPVNDIWRALHQCVDVLRREGIDPRCWPKAAEMLRLEEP